MEPAIKPLPTVSPRLLSCWQEKMTPSVPLLTGDSQIGANLRVCADEENRADLDQRGRSRTIGAVGSGPKHAAEGGLEGADRVAGERWTDSGGDCGGAKKEAGQG